MRMLAFYIAALAIVLVTVIITVQIMHEFGYAATAVTSMITGTAALVGFGLLVQRIEERYGIKIIDSPR
jgi:hypothetical protein